MYLSFFKYTGHTLNSSCQLYLNRARGRSGWHYHYKTKMLAEAFLSLRDLCKMDKIPPNSPPSFWLYKYTCISSELSEAWIFKALSHFKGSVSTCCFYLAHVNQGAKLISSLILLLYRNTLHFHKPFHSFNNTKYLGVARMCIQVVHSLSPSH